VEALLEETFLLQEQSSEVLVALEHILGALLLL